MAVGPKHRSNTSHQTVMLHKTTLNYTESLLRQAVYAFWRRTVGVGFFVALSLLACSLAWMLWQGDRSWAVGAVGAFLFFGFGFAALVYVVHLRNTLGKFRAMGAASAELELGEASFVVSSSLGSSTLAWSAVTEVWRFESFWLVLFSKAQFVTLPLACVGPEMQAFIVSRVLSAGGKVVD
jgi:hypothetical protein